MLRTVASTSSSDKLELPKLNLISASNSETSEVKIGNDTEYPLEVFYSGDASEMLKLEPKSSDTLTLPNGEYRILVRAKSHNVHNFVGRASLSGGKYESKYYIGSPYSFPR